MEDWQHDQMVEFMLDDLIDQLRATVSAIRTAQQLDRLNGILEILDARLLVEFDRVPRPIHRMVSLN